MSRRRSRLRRDVEPADLQGLPTRRYVRESTVGQALEDRNGPALQRADIARYVAKHGLQPPEHEYFDAASGTSTDGRPGLQQALADAEAGLYKVLACYNTSRSFRNAEDAIVWKRKFAEAGVTIVFTEPEIIAGNHRTRWQEGIMAIADAERSAEQGRMIGNGLRQKFLAGKHNGHVPLGYHRYHGEPGDVRNGELLVNDAEAPTVRVMVEQYCTGTYSNASLAAWLNAQVGEDGQPLHRTRRGRPFTKGAVEETLGNVVYQGLVAWHPGCPEEEVRPGKHEPLISEDAWAQIQAIRARRTRHRGPSSGRRRSYSLSGVATCDGCGAQFHGDTGGRNGQRRLRRALATTCTSRQSFSADALEAQLATLLTDRFRLPAGWEQKIAAAVAARTPTVANDTTAEKKRLEEALAKLKQLYVWGDLAEAEYRRQRSDVERSLAELDPVPHLTTLDDARRTAELLQDAGQLFSHPGVSGEQRKQFVAAFVEEVRLDENGIAALRPRPAFVPVLAVSKPAKRGGYGRGETSLTGATPLAEWSWRRVVVLRLELGRYRQGSVRGRRAMR